MKKNNIIVIVTAAMALIGFMSCGSTKTVSSNKLLTTEIDSVSYILGKASGFHMIKQATENMEIWPEKGNKSAFFDGLNDILKNPGDSLFLGKDFEGAGEYINSFFQSMNQRAAEKNKAEGDAFLAENKTKSGVITTESGLQYKIITEGAGSKPSVEDQVRVHYTGKMLDGSVFDSSYERGEPAVFPLTNVIPGWTEGLQLMPAGSKFILWIPSELAYGMNPPSPTIKPNSMLEFEIELFEIVTEE